jgi:hypothetical protein
VRPLFPPQLIPSMRRLSLILNALFAWCLHAAFACTPYLIESFNWSRGPVTAGTCIQMRALIQERLVRHTSCCDRSAITILGVEAVVVSVDGITAKRIASAVRLTPFKLFIKKKSTAIQARAQRLTITASACLARCCRKSLLERERRERREGGGGGLFGREGGERQGGEREGVRE